MSAERERGACLVCGAAGTTVWTSAIDVEYGAVDETFDYRLCAACDALSIDPLPADRLAEIYPPTYYSFASGGDVLGGTGNPVTRFKTWLDLRTARGALALTGASAPRVLDVGGGTGAQAVTLVRAGGEGAHGTVVDIDPDSIAAARERGLDGFAGRFEDFETDARFDLISMLNLIEHVPDPVAMLAKARSLLAPGGVLWVQTPNFRSLDARLFRRRSWTGLHCPRHFVVFGTDGLRQALGRAGLEPVRFATTQGGSFWATSLLAGRRARQGPPLRTPSGALPRPLIQHPAFMPLAAAGAAFDLATNRLRATSQVVVLARRAPDAPDAPPAPRS